MWRVDECRAYPFRHKHINHFPPPIKESDDEEDYITESYHFEERRREEHLEEEEEEEEEVPIFFAMRLPEARPGQQRQQQQQATKTSAETIKNYPLTPPLTTPPAFSFPMMSPGFPLIPEPPLSPSAAAPANLTSLLQEVLGIMNVIMSEQGGGSVIPEENEANNVALQELVELVVIMQDEAEALVDLADIVEEYVDEIAIAEQVQEIEEWVDDMKLESPSTRAQQQKQEQRGHMRKEPIRRAIHEREDSGIGLDDEEILDGILPRVAYQHPPQPQRPQRNEVLVQEDVFTRPKITIQHPTVMDLRVKKSPKMIADVPSLSKPRKMRQRKAPPPSPVFRDSGLGLMTPDRSPKRNPPRWL